MKGSTVLVGCLVLLAAPLVAGSSLSGEWAYQALNSGDTSFKVEQKGEDLTFYRVLHAEYEGKPYLLEHMYRGKLAGKKIDGKMFVREEGMKDFEFLRPFKGEVVSDEKLVMDDLPLKRQEQVVAPPTDEPPPNRYAKVIINRDHPKSGGQDEPRNQTAAAPTAIPSLVPVANQIQTETGRAADKALVEGDTAYEARKYQEAVDKYDEALKLNPHKVEVLYKLGLCHGILGDQLKRTGEIGGASDNLKRAVQFWERAVHFDPYNTGAKENIHRAQEKLQKLEYK